MEMIRFSTVLVGISIAGSALAGQEQVVQFSDKIQDCSNAADRVLSKTNGRLLSVKRARIVASLPWLFKMAGNGQKRLSFASIMPILIVTRIMANSRAR